MGDQFKINGMHVVRGLQGLLAILTLSLLAHVAQWFNTEASSSSASTIHAPNEVAFAIFVSVLTLLVTLPYILIVPRYFPHLLKSRTKHSVLIVETISMILWFSAFVAVAAILSKMSVCKGTVCTVAKVGTGFAAISWVTWGVTSLFALRFCLGCCNGGGAAKSAQDNHHNGTFDRWGNGGVVNVGDAEKQANMREKVLGKLKGKFHGGWVGGQREGGW